MQPQQLIDTHVLLDAAIALHRQGRLGEAQKIYSSLLELDSANLNVLQLWGMLATQSNQSQLALELAQRAAKISPENAFLHCNLGMALHAVDRPGDALQSMDIAIELNPHYSEAFCARGVIFEALGRLDEALQDYESAIRLNPKYPEVYFNQGNVLLLCDRPVEAIQRYDLAITFNPQYADAYNNRGNAYKSLNDYSAALKSYEKAIFIDAQYADAYNNHGVILTELEVFDQALLSYKKAIEQNPNNPEYYRNQANLYIKTKYFDLAVKSYSKALELEPESAESWSGLGKAYKHIPSHNDQAARYICLDSGQNKSEDFSNNIADIFETLDYPNRVLYLYLLTRCSGSSCANCNGDVRRLLEELQSLDIDNFGVNKKLPSLKQTLCTYCFRLCSNFYSYLTAFICFCKASRVDSTYARAHNNCAVLLSEMGLVRESVDCYDRAIALDPEYAAAYHNKSMTLLLGGDYLSGWSLYEWRWKKNDDIFRPSNFNVPLWLGDAPIEGKTILIHCEQGYGDTLQFCRYIPWVKSLGANVIFSVPEPLQKLMQTLHGVDILLENGITLPQIDFHCPLLSLPLAFKTEVSSVPCAIPYLSSEVCKVEQWLKVLGNKTQPRVGLVWNGNPKHKNDYYRSIALELFLQHLPSDLDYICLQKTHSDFELGLFDQYPHLRQFGSRLTDFSDTASLVSIMDLVISVDTSVAHLAGALGKTTWVLLPFAPDWRWLLDRNDSPWYPTAKLYRQSDAMSWQDVLNKVHNDLMLFQS